MKTGLIGLGAMGARMARNLAKHRLLAAVWNRTEGVARNLAEQLAVPCAESPARLAEAVDAVLLCVAADRDVLEVIQRLLPGLRPTSLVIDLSTVSPETARQAASLVAERGAEFLDAPVTGGVEGAENGTLAIMVGGEVSTFHRARPVLAAIGNRIVHMGPSGAGQAAKAVNQIMAAGINQAVTEALAFGAHLGLPMDRLIEVVAGGAAGNWFLEKRGPTLVRGSFQPGFKLALHYKDLRICKAQAEQLGIATPVLDLTLRDYAQLLEQGYGTEDISALYRLKRPGGATTGSAS
ncbi:NAD(P)-dependent oxidoreductase [Candidatus Methylocalor cossyra]|uniref:2-hydroxy-3-oxopropionate reductase n=1 Tax=Candidatus Methylocalor cossyra TaxID=3108543 RepID=A0ABM9NM92_9GAMM